MKNILIVWGEFLNYLAGTVIFYFYVGPVCLGLLQIRSLWKKREWRLITCVSLFFAMWRVVFFGTLTDSGSARYSQVLCAPLLLFAIPGFLALYRFLEKKFYRGGILFFSVLLVIVGIGNILKIIRLPKTQPYFVPIAETLKDYENNGLCIDGTRKMVRLAHEYHCSIPVETMPSASDYTDASEYWRSVLDRNISRSEHIFVVQDEPEALFLEAVRNRSGEVPVKKIGSWKFRNSRVSLWKLVRPLNGDWATPGRSYANPDPMGFKLPQRIAVARGKAVFFDWHKLVAANNWRDYIYEVACPYGFLYGDGFYYIADDDAPEQTELTVSVHDAEGLLVASRKTIIANVSSEAQVQIPSFGKAQHFSLTPPTHSAYRVPQSSGQTYYLPRGPVRVYFDPLLLMPNTKRFQWEFSGVSGKAVADWFNGVEFTLGEKPVELHLCAVEKNGPIATEMTLRIHPLEFEAASKRKIITIITGSNDSKTGPWPKNWQEKGNFLFEIPNWDNIRTKLEDGLWNKALQESDAVIVDVPYYNKNLLPDATQIASTLNLLRAKAPQARIVIGAPPPSPGSQDAWAAYSNKFQNRDFRDWQYREGMNLFSSRLQTQIDQIGDSEMILVGHCNIGEREDFPVAFDPRVGREIVGNYYLLSRQGRKKMIENLLNAARAKGWK